MFKQKFSIFNEAGAAEGGGSAPPTPPPPASQPDILGALNRIDAGLSALAAGQQRASQPPPPPPTSPDDVKKDFFTKFYDKPLETVGTLSAAIAQRAVQEANPMGQLPIDTLVANAQSTARNSLTAENQQLWDKYVDEIRTRAISTQAPPQLLMNHQFWLNAFRMLVGEKISEIRADAMKESEKNRAPAVHVKNGGPMSTTPPAYQPNNKIALSEEEARVAAGFGLSHEEYAEGKRLLDGQSVRGPSSWDEYVTFDSDKKRREARKKEVKK